MTLCKICEFFLEVFLVRIIIIAILINSPEVYGGLPTPRTPAERIGSRVVTAAGADVTAQYRKGAEIALQLARLTGCRVAVLKANSPSCGHGTIYDGTFSGKKIPGSGVAAELLEQNGIAVYTDEDCAAALPF